MDQIFHRVEWGRNKGLALIEPAPVLKFTYFRHVVRLRPPWWPAHGIPEYGSGTRAKVKFIVGNMMKEMVNILSENLRLVGRRGRKAPKWHPRRPIFFVLLLFPFYKAENSDPSTKKY